MVWGLKHNLFRRLDSFNCLYIHVLAVIGEKFDVDLMKQNVCFWIRMSDEGVGGEAYSHEEMRKQDSLYCCMCRILVVFGEMVDVDLMK